MDSYSGMSLGMDCPFDQVEGSASQPDGARQNPSHFTSQSNPWVAGSQSVNPNGLINASEEPMDEPEQWASSHLTPFSMNFTSFISPLDSPASTSTNTEPVIARGSCGIVLGEELTLFESSPASPFMASIATNPVINSTALMKKLYECSLYHAGENDDTKPYLWKSQITANASAPIATSQLELSSSQCTKPKNTWKRKSCLQRHIAETHVYFFKEKDSGHFVCCFCPCSWPSNCAVRSEQQIELIEHISEKHSEPAIAHYRYNHFCDPLLVDSN